MGKGFFLIVNHLQDLESPHQIRLFHELLYEPDNTKKIIKIIVLTGL